MCATPTKLVDVCIIGAGATGQDLALELARRGPVKLLTCKDSSDDVAEIKADLRKKLDHVKWCNDVDFVLSNVRIHTDITAAAGSKLIIECLAEDAAAKRRLFAELKPYVRDGSLVATSTSSLSVGYLFDGILPGTHTFGLHFFHPIRTMKLVEVIIGSQTPEEAVELARKLAESMNKEVMLVNGSPILAPISPSTSDNIAW